MSPYFSNLTRKEPYFELGTYEPRTKIGKISQKRHIFFVFKMYLEYHYEVNDFLMLYCEKSVIQVRHIFTNNFRELVQLNPSVVTFSQTHFILANNFACTYYVIEISKKLQTKCKT